MKYTNILSLFENSVWYATPEHAERIRSFAEGVSAGDIAAMREKFDAAVQAGLYNDPLAAAGVVVRGSTAIVPIHGTIAKRLNMMSHFSGGVSTDMLTATFEMLAEDDRIERVVLDVDSGGGSVKGVEVATRALRALSKRKETIAVANDMMASAAYYIASAARKIYVTPSSTVGSIGVIAMIADQSEALEKAGVKYHVVRAGEFKALLNGVEPVTETALKELEESVNKYYADFVNAIAINLNISNEQAKEMADGRTYEGIDAVEAGLADGEMTLEEIMARIESEEDLQIALDNAKQVVAAMGAANVALDAKLSEALGQVKALTEQVEGIKAERLAVEAMATVDAAIEAGKVAPTKRDKYLAMAKEHGVEHVKDIFADIATGAVAPIAENVDEKKAETDPAAPQTALEQSIFAQFPSLRK